ncbi:DUF5703 domain-containing protein [Aureibaculum sp. 2210JD6-5]|uniref:DUF5703 domain-containing protein n=1 Tax=Aureibaculum sp. 2210JD6-5 TaxID=3103957 RepID=UPI002AAD035B|nr:DUF5703 domain-containing protein [Aureibaculum sp. 2210JD6-5]MDY7396895.1 DUF5703 domain-containing protein [Aureibaculum sp. 2210JD6-5]
MMNKLVLLSFLVLCCTIKSNAQNTNALKTQIDRYNVIWHSQSKNSSESMPLGGGDIGCNVWVENGDILFYISKSGTFDENNQFLKLGRGRIRLEPNILADSEVAFSQELKLYDGYIQIKGKKDGEEVEVNLWVDVLNAVINVEVHASKQIKLKAFYENWRTAKRVLPLEERHACFSYSNYPETVVTWPDSIAYDNNGVKWFHRNRSDTLLFNFAVKQQGLESVKNQMVNTQKNRTFGGVMFGENLKPSHIGEGKYIDTPYTFWSLESNQKAKYHNVKVILHTEQAETLDAWEKNLSEISKSFNKKSAWDKTKAWWHDYWNRSHIFINTDANDPSDKGWQVGRNYQLFRYQLGCNAYGDYPTKFNGSLFTYDPYFVKQRTEPYHGTPDYRSWGGGSFTAQNQRLVYWPMLKSGDFDMMKPQFDFYNRVLKNAELRSQVYWNHVGACYTEQIENFGLPVAGAWGFKSGPRTRDPKTPFGEQTNPWVKHHYTTQLEFAFMIMKYYQYTGKDISEYIPLIKSATEFFFEHYKYRQTQRTGKPLDDNGKLVLYPSTAAETYKEVTNPTDLCAALKATVKAIIALPRKYLSEGEKQKWQDRLTLIPELKYGEVNGHRILAAANNLPGKINSEITELYPVFPYELYGIGYPDLQTAINTWQYGDLSKNHISWHQDGIFCARMGLTDEAKRIAVLKLQDSERRFPTFWGPGHDYVPDHNWGGSGMIGLQDMLLQSANDKIYLFPAWPAEWDVDFKLHAPKNTTIEASFENGEIRNMSVSPNERLKNIVIKN